MAPVLKTGEAFRVSVGSNPTPSAPTMKKALPTSTNAVRQGLSLSALGLAQFDPAEMTGQEPVVDPEPAHVAMIARVRVQRLLL